MANLIHWITKAANGETILAIVVGDKNDYTGNVKQPVEWDEAHAELDYDFSDGFGESGCHSIFAWTESYVIFVSCYDGSTTINAIPRNPGPSTPYMPGGG